MFRLNFRAGIMDITCSVFILLLTSIIGYSSGGSGQLGSSCYYDDECDTTTTYCKGRQSCQCKDNFVESDGKCVATAGARCINSQECSSLANSECKDSVCVCREGYVAHNTKYTCLAVAGFINSPCEIDEQCTRRFGPFSGCISSECQCRDNYHFHNNYCFQNTGLGQRCANESYCYLSETEKDKITCSGNTCVCAQNFTAEGNTCVDTYAFFSSPASL